MKKQVIIITLLVLVVLAWAPWISSNRAYDFLSEDESYKLACEEYKFVPQPAMPKTLDQIMSPGFFGKSADDCGKRWFITFWGGVIER